MTSSISKLHADPGFPRYFKICGSWVNAFQVFLCAGIYTGILVSAALAARSGISPLRVGLGCLACAVVGLVGARIYHLLVFAPHYLRQRSWAALWNSKSGGVSVFGSLVSAAPISVVAASVLRIPIAVFWDYMSAGILFGGFWIRLGCVFNGCCGGRETKAWCGVRLHDTNGVRKRRIPVQFLEMAWWLVGGAGFIWLWPKSFAAGNYVLGVLGWYGLGRLWLESLREAPDLVFGRVRINQVVAAVLAIATGGGLLFRAWGN